MFNLSIKQLNTPGVIVHKATITGMGTSLSHTCEGTVDDAVTGLILDIGRFKNEAIGAISKQLREDRS